MPALFAAGLGLLLLLAVTGYAPDQLRRGGLDPLMRAGLVLNLTGVAVLWLRTDKPVEGRVLLVLGTGHGLTASDLLVVLPLAVALPLVTGQVSRVSALLKRR